MSKPIPHRKSAAALLAALITITNAFPSHGTQERFDCVIDPARVVRVASSARGILAEVIATRGATLKKGDVVARLEATVETRTVELNKVRAADNTSISSAKDRLALAEKDLDRALQLQESNVISQKVLDELSTAARVAANELSQAKLQKSLAKLELARSKAILELRTIRSPISGVVTERNLSAGEFVREDAEILTVVELDPLHVETFVPQRFFGTIAPGQTASVELMVPVGEIHDATVTVIDSVLDPASGTFGIRLELPNPNERLAGGVRCSLTFNEVPAIPPPPN